MPSLFHSAPLVFALAVLLRLILLFWGRYQDTHSPLKYTDIDYLVFTDASRFVSRSRSPYARDTYRYTPLLAWLLYPTAFGGFWFEFGKVLFALGDVVTGWLAYSILTSGKAEMSKERALKYASIWLLNPMVANISTRGSSEGLLAVIVVALLWAVMSKYIRLAGVLLGLAVHFKIYPFIYAASIFWWLDETNVGTCDLQSMALENPTILNRYLAFFNRKRLQLAIFSLVTFMGLNLIMLRMYVCAVKHWGCCADQFAGMVWNSLSTATHTTSSASIIGITSRSTTRYFILSPLQQTHQGSVWSL